MRVFRHEPPANTPALRPAPPAPDPALAASVDQLMNYDDIDQLLLDGRWIPSTPVEVAAALRALAGSISCVWDRGSTPTLPSLEEHVLALESLIVGRDVRHLADLDEDPALSVAGRAEFQRLYQRFDEQRRAGEDAGLHQRLTEAEARIARLEARPEVVADLEERVVLLEERLDPGADYGTSSGPEDDDAPAMDMLWANYHEEDGTRRAPKRGVEHEPIDDIENGHLRPQTWAQLCDCLSEIARWVHSLVTDLGALEDSGRPMQELVANLNRAVMASSPRPAADVAEAFVLETVTRLLTAGRKDGAWKLQTMWHFVELYSQGLYKEADELAKRFRLVQVNIDGELVA
jgi:hypothetical protein